MSYLQNSPAFTGIPTAPTASLSTNTTQLATCAFVMANATSGALTAIGVTTANGISGSSSGGATPSLTLTLGAITPLSVNALTLAALTNGFTVAGGSSSSKTLTVSNTLTLAGTDGSTLNIGAGGALGTAAYATIANYVATSTLGALGGVATLDGTGKLTTAQIPSALVGALNYQGTWNASTNTSPVLASGVGTKGYYYKVSVAGTTTIDGCSTWSIGDILAFNGTTWDKIDGDATVVTSVNGSVGSVTVAAINQTMYLGTTALTINALTGTQTTLSGMTAIGATTFTGALTGNASTATSLASGSTGALPYQSGSGVTAFLSAGTASQVLVGGASSPAWSNTPAISGANITAGSTPWSVLPTGFRPATISTTSITGTTTLTGTSDYVICDATTAAFTLTLPTSPATGTNYTIKKIDSTAHAVTISGGSTNIDSATTFLLPAQWNSITVVYNGTQWFAF